MSTEAPSEAVRILRDLVASNKRAAVSGPARRIMTSRHHALLRYWFLACFEKDRHLPAGDVADVADHIDEICRSKEGKSSRVRHWWPTILPLVLPPEPDSSREVAADRWTGIKGWKQFAAFEALASLNPQRAKESFQRHWKAFPDTRLLHWVRRTFSLADEGFLKEASAHKNKGFRVSVAEAWCSIRGSSLAEQVWADIRGCLALRGETLVVVPPERHTPAMAALGVEKKGPAGPRDPKWWLCDCLHWLPCAYWSDELGVSPGELVRIATASRVDDAYVRALQFSTRQSQDAAWARAFLDNEDFLRGLFGPDADPRSNDRLRYRDLVRALPPAERDPYSRRIVEEVLGENTAYYDDAPFLIWSKELGDAALWIALLAPVGDAYSPPVPEDAFCGGGEPMTTLAWHLSPESGDALEQRMRGGEVSRIAAIEIKQAMVERDAIRAAFGL
jgi:hypothetical protein